MARYFPNKDPEDPDRGTGVVPIGLLSPTALRPPVKQAITSPFAEVTIDTPGNDNGVSVDPKSGTITIINDDGTVDIDFTGEGPAKPDKPSKFGDNLADIIDYMELGRIASTVIEGIQQDEQSRQEWLTARAEGMRLLGLKVKQPRSAVDTTASLEGMSSIDHPLLLEAVLNFWANASSELLPAAGPVKIGDRLGMTGQSMKLAEKLEEDFNYYLTTVATEYYPDTSRALLNVGFGGLIVKKVYNCPLRQRPVSESIDAVDLIVSNAATDLRNSGRYTHQIKMRPSVLRRMQLAGAYRDVAVTTPSGVVPNAVDQQIANIQGVQIVSQQTEDREHTIYECYCELNIVGFEDKRDGKVTGLPLPYRVVIDKDSQQVLEIRRNWSEGDDTKTAKVAFVVYVFVPGFGFYGIGLLNILGNTTKTLTASWREMVDSGMFANFPGFIYSKLAGRQNTNEFRVPPGGGIGLDLQGGKIGDFVMPLPYKDIGPGFAQFMDKVQETGQRLGGSAQINVAEGKQDAPVGTTLAMLEQATRVEKATHKELWRAQSQEFMLLKDCFRENPGAFVKAIKQRGATDWDEDSFLAALNDASLVPQADPNTPSHMHRLMKSMGLIQLDKAYPGIMDPVEIVDRIVTMLGLGDFESLKNKNPQAAGIPPELMLEMQKLADKSQDREFKQQFEMLKTRNAMMLANQAADAERRKQQGQAMMQQQESRDQELQQGVDLRQSEMALEEARVNAGATVSAEQLRAQTAHIAGQHEVKAEEARQDTEDTKGKHAVAAAKAKPKPRPAAKPKAK